MVTLSEEDLNNISLHWLNDGRTVVVLAKVLDPASAIGLGESLITMGSQTPHELRQDLFDDPAELQQQRRNLVVDWDAIPGASLEGSPE